MFKKTHKLSALAMAGIMALTTAVPVFATDTVLTVGDGSGTVRVYANVASVYYLELPASITFREANEDGDNSKDLYYTADYGCNVYGTLFGQKVTLSPKLNTGDTAGTYHIKMDPLKRNEDGSIKMDNEGNLIVDDHKDKLDVTVRQSVYEWVPAGAANLESQQRKISHEQCGDASAMAQGVLNTDTAAAPDTTYKGALTFFVSCEDLH